MTDYISREALLERVSKVKDKLELDLNKPFDDGVRIGFENVEIEIENFPAADVRPVVRGEVDFGTSSIDKRWLLCRRSMFRV